MDTNHSWILPLTLLSLTLACTTDKTSPDPLSDEDGDGFPLADDCDDTDPSRYPGAPELCDDGLVQDCDATEADAQAACSWSGEVDLADADARLLGDAPYALAGETVAAAGDLNGDGLADMAIGAPSYGQDGGRGSEPGVAFVVSGPATGELNLADARARLVGEEEGDEAGYALSAVGDVDDDGEADLAVGAPGLGGVETGTGAVYLVPASASGSFNLAESPTRLLGAVGDAAGSALAAAGDLDGDGRPDLAVGAVGHDGDGEESGAAYVVLGPVSGDVHLSDATARLLGEKGDRAGSALASAGDVDGDGQNDLLVGAPEHHDDLYLRGAAYLVRGPVTGDLDLGDATARLLGEEAGDHAGHAVSTAGDVNGDGLADLLVGAPYYDGEATWRGAAYLVLGPVSGEHSLADAHARLLGEQREGSAGWSVSTAGDVNGDERDDLLIGAPLYAEGAAYLVLGPVSGEQSLADAQTRFGGAESGPYVGWSVSTAGDVNADGLSDVLVGAYLNDAGGERAGAAYLLLSPSY